jgi:hypothetical protein
MTQIMISGFAHNDFSDLTASRLGYIGERVCVSGFRLVPLPREDMVTVFDVDVCPERKELRNPMPLRSVLRHLFQKEGIFPCSPRNISNLRREIIEPALATLARVPVVHLRGDARPIAFAEFANELPQ